MNQGKIAIITGGSSGIGLAIADSFLQRGIPVYLLARNEQRLQEAKNVLAQKHDAPILIESADATKPGSIERIIETVLKQPRELIFVNNAGAWSFMNEQEGYENTPEHLGYESIFAVNTFAPTRLAQYLISRFKNEKESSLHLLTNLSHIVFRPELDSNASYGPSKVALADTMLRFEAEMLLKKRKNPDLYSNIRFGYIYPASTASKFAVENYKAGIFDAPTSLESVAESFAEQVFGEPTSNHVYVTNVQKPIPQIINSQDDRGIMYYYMEPFPTHNGVAVVDRRVVDKEFDVEAHMKK